MKRTVLIALATCLLAGPLAAPLAHADYEPIGSGQTRFTLDRAFLADCKAEGVKLAAIAPAKLSGGVLTVPAVAGKFDPVAAKGTVESEGGLLLSAGGRKVPLKALKLRTSQVRSPFMAKVGGSQLKIATAKKLKVARAGFSDRVAVSGLALSRTLATRLGKKLDRKDLFKAGLPLGESSTLAIPTTISLLEKGTVTLTLDPAFVAKLQSLFVAVNPIFPAEHQGSVFTLPIFVGEISTDGAKGQLEMLGKLEFLQLGGGQVFWAEPWLELEAHTLTAEVDAEPSPPYTGKTGRLTVAPATMAEAATAVASARTVSAAFSLTMDPAMAKTFEEAFAKPQGKTSMFAAGEAVGTIGFTAQVQ